MARRFLVSVTIIVLILGGCNLDNSSLSGMDLWNVSFALTGKDTVSVDAIEGGMLSLWIAYENIDEPDFMLSFESEASISLDVPMQVVARGSRGRCLLSFRIEPYMFDGFKPWVSINAINGNHGNSHKKVLNVFCHRADTFEIDANTSSILIDEGAKATQEILVKNEGDIEKDLELTVTGYISKARYSLSQTKVRIGPHLSKTVMLEGVPVFQDCIEELSVTASYSPNHCKGKIEKRTETFRFVKRLSWDVCFASNGKDEITVDGSKALGGSLKLRLTNRNNCSLELAYSLWSKHEGTQGFAEVPPDNHLVLDYPVDTDMSFTHLIDFIDQNDMKKTLKLVVVNSEFGKQTKKIELVKHDFHKQGNYQARPFGISCQNGFLLFSDEDKHLILYSSSGSLLWKYRVNSCLLRSYTTREDRLYLIDSSNDKDGYTLDCVSLVTGSLVWQAKIKNPLDCPRLSVLGQAVRLVDRANTFWFDLISGSPLTDKDLASHKTGVVLEEVTASDGKEFNKTYTCSKDGVVLWEKTTRHWDSIVAGNGQIFYFAADEDINSCILYKLDPDSGNVVWKKTMRVDDVVVHGDYILALNNTTASCDILDARNGQLLDSIESIISKPVVCGEYILVSSADGYKTQTVYKIARK